MIGERKLDINLKKKLSKNKLTVGSWITLADCSIAEIMSKSGFDWLVVDMEHSAIELPQAQQLIQIIELGGCVPLVRVGENNPNLIKRVMDTGAHGVIVPMVNTKEDAICAVEALRYPPRGKRGVGLARAQGYGINFEGYKNWTNKNSVLIVQIEHIDAVNNLEQILEINGVDGFIVGPYDLSGSMGKPGEFNHSEVKAALGKIKLVAKKLRKPAGIHVISPDYREVNERIRDGYRFIAFSLDILFLGKSCNAGISKIKKDSIRTNRQAKK